MSEYSAALRSKYEAMRGIYKQFTAKNVALLEDIFKSGSDFHSIEARTKDLDSFEIKVDLPEKEQKYKDISEITDLTGIRIICFLQEDVERVCQKIEKIYEIDRENSINKDDQLEPDQFGYRSRHFVVKFNENRAALPENDRFVGLKAEIQVRTILQHAWAAIDWKLRYKNVDQTPQIIRRRVFRVSALLELADDEFSSLSESISSIRSDYREKIASGDLALSIDRESVDLFLEQDDQLSKLVDHALEVGFSVNTNHTAARDPHSAVLRAAQNAGFTSIEDIKQSILPISQKSNNKLKKLHQTWHVNGGPDKIILTKAGLVRLSIILSLPADRAKIIAEAIPFGENLQEAVLKVIMAQSIAK